MKKKVLLILAVVFVVISSLSASTFRRAVKASDSVPAFELIAHRGFEDQYPENTVYSARMALKLGTPVEFDVQFTGDGEMVIMHDDSVDRTTNGTGIVRDLQASYIKGLDAGVKYSKKYEGVMVPTFKEYLDSIRNMPYMYPELKSYRNEEDIRTFTKFLLDNGFEYRATILSFGYSKTLPVIRELSKDIRVGALAGNQQDFEKDVEIAKKDKNSVLVISKMIANKENFEKCSKENLDVVVWTVRNEKEAKELSRLGYRKFISSRYFKMN